MKIEFVAITELNSAEFMELRVAKEQEKLVESVRQSLAEARSLSLWKPVGIYCDEILIGFAMYGFWQDEGMHGRVWLDRFFIDERYQGKGYGRCCLQALLAHIAMLYKTSEIYLSVYEENSRAIDLYQSMGFCLNGEIDIHGEKVMVLFISK